MQTIPVRGSTGVGHTVRAQGAELSGARSEDGAGGQTSERGRQTAASAPREDVWQTDGGQQRAVIELSSRPIGFL